MSKPAKYVQAQKLEKNQRIIDPDGKVATVKRYRWIDHQRGRLETDLGVAVVQHVKRFQVIS